MFEYERHICRAAGTSWRSPRWTPRSCGSSSEWSRVSDIPTGVDIEYFTRPAAAPPGADLVFVGSMDWLPNIDGVLWFVREVLPLIRNRSP